MPAGKIIQDPMLLPELGDIVVIDTETSGLSAPHGDRICGIGVTIMDSEAICYYIPIRHRPSKRDMEYFQANEKSLRGDYVNIPVEPVLQWLQRHFNDAGREWIMHNAKFDLNMFAAEGLEFHGKVRCTMVEAHDVHGSRFSYALDSLTNVYVPWFQHCYYEKVKSFLEATQRHRMTDEGKVPFNYSRLPIALAGVYCMEDLVATRNLAAALDKARAVLAKKAYNGDRPSYTGLEMLEHDQQLLRVIAQMERDGVRIDVNRCMELREENQEFINNACEQLFELVGSSFNVGSWKHKQKALEKIGGKVVYWMRPEIKDQNKYPNLSKDEFRKKQKMAQYTTDEKKSTGRPCWNAEALLAYLKAARRDGNETQYMFFKHLYDIDSRQRILSTYINAYLCNIDVNRRLHGSFNQHGTRTGRLSSSNPNCFSDDTEVLTKRGWVLFADLLDTDLVAQYDENTGEITFAAPLAKQ